MEHKSDACIGENCWAAAECVSCQGRASKLLYLSTTPYLPKDIKKACLGIPGAAAVLLGRTALKSDGKEFRAGFSRALTTLNAYRSTPHDNLRHQIERSSGQRDEEQLP